MKKLLSIVFGFFLIFLGSCGIIRFAKRPSHARLAAQYRGEKRYEEAIREYQEHIASRLGDSRREPEENPYFYLILVGDIYLEQANTARALESYLEAKSKDVEPQLIVDRIRRVGRAFHDAKKYREAIELLKKYRALDEFGFDLDIDENLKEIVKLEDQQVVK